MAVDPIPAAWAASPVTWHPARVRAWRSSIGSRDPDVAATVPAVIAALPDPVRMADRPDRNDLTHRWRRSNADIDLRLCRGCGQGESGA